MTRRKQPRRCRVCFRVLRADPWRTVGVGPICARKLGLLPARQPAAPVAPLRPAAPLEGQLDLFELADHRFRSLNGAHRCVVWVGTLADGRNCGLPPEMHVEKGADRHSY